MKFNKQMIDELKNKIVNIKNKVTSNNKEKVPKKYYALLILMLLLGTLTLSSNIHQYNKSRQQDFDEYKLEDQYVSSNVIHLQTYETAQSSINTTVGNIQEDEQAVPTISNNEKTKYIMPVEGEVIKEFAVEKLVYSETLGMWKTHPGIDIKAMLNTIVKSASEGIVEEVKKDSFYGNTVMITNNDGYTFAYSNLDDDISLNKGDRVEKGAVIGKIGVSAKGELQEQTHLHFEVIKDGKQVNPQDLIN